MLQGARVAVVMPAFNEAGLIGPAIHAVPAFVDHVIVIDDASTDGTAAQAFRAGDRRVQVVQHERNRGVGASIVTGYQIAFNAGADVAAVMAGDGQMDPNDLAQLLGPVIRGGADYAKGDRLGFPEARAHMPRARFFGNHILSLLTRWATGLSVRDSQCGYTALSREAATQLDLTALWPRYGYPNDLLARLARTGMRVRDVVVRPVYGSEGSGVGWRHALVVIPFVLARALAARAGCAVRLCPRRFRSIRPRRFATAKARLVRGRAP